MRWTARNCDSPAAGRQSRTSGTSWVFYVEGGEELALNARAKATFRTSMSTGYYVRVFIPANLANPFLPAGRGRGIRIRTDQDLVPYATRALDDSDFANRQPAF